MDGSAARLRRARQAAGIARDVLARAIGKSPTTLQRWEGEGIPNARALLELARQLGCPVEWLLGANEEPRKRRRG